MLTESGSTNIQIGLTREERSGYNETLGVWDIKKKG